MLTSDLYLLSYLYTEHIVNNKTTAKGLTQEACDKKCYRSSLAPACSKASSATLRLPFHSY